MQPARLIARGRGDACPLAKGELTQVGGSKQTGKTVATYQGSIQYDCKLT